MNSIFQRYGGFAVFRRVVSSFYDRVLESDVISHHFGGVDMRALIDHQTQFIAFVTGGPVTNFSDELLRRVHAPLHITPAEFEEMRRLLRETLDDYEFAGPDIAAIDREVAARRAAIVTAP